jgi:hypothetical protein
MRNLLILPVIVLLASCAPASPPPPSSPPPAPQALLGQPDGGFSGVENAQVGRAYLVGDQAYGPTKDNLPFGVILLRRGDDERNRQLCNSFVDNIATVSDIQAADADINVIATYWLLRQPLSPERLLDCEALLENYHWGRALQIRSAYSMANAQGPVFLALRLNRGLQIPPDVFLLDLSRQSPEQVATTTVNWFDIVIAQSDDQAIAQEMPVQTAATTRGGSWFQKLLNTIGGLLCSVITDPDQVQTVVNFVDPVLPGVSGTLKKYAGPGSIVAVGVATVGRVLCPGTAAAGNLPPLQDLAHDTRYSLQGLTP